MERLKERRFQLLKAEKGSKDSKEGGGQMPTPGANTPTPTNNRAIASESYRRH
jgi:hypothetical protein